MKDLRQTKEYSEYMKAIGWTPIEVKSQKLKVKSYVRKIPLIGNIAKIQRPERIPTIKQLDRLAKTHKLAALYLEPMTNDTMTNDYFSFAKNSFVPAKTIHIDLTKSEEKLLKEMKHKTRYNIKQAQKHGVIVKESTDIEAFIKLWQTSARRRGMLLPQTKEIRALYRAFGKNSHLLFATVQHYTEATVAGVFMITTKDTAYYMYAFSTPKGNKLFAPTLLAWEVTRLAKRKGCKVFDFEGIYDERYPETRQWQGFTRFKKGFGGKVVTYPRTLVKYYNPFARILNL